MSPTFSWLFRTGRAVLAIGFGSCQFEPLAAAPTTVPASAVEQASLVRAIELPHLEPELAVAPGRDEFLMACVGCHSPRYVQMQPLFNQRQWEQIVDKMVTSYSAQVDPAQRAAIVGYLVVTHGPNSTVQPASNHDDDSEAMSAPAMPAFVETSPALDVLADVSRRAAQAQRGASLFADSCAACHGPEGRGDGFVAPVLWRKPKDLTATRFSVRLLSQVLWNGKRGTAMPSWRGLPLEDRAALAAYVQSLHQSEQVEPASAQSIQQGSKVFVQNCAPCHGEAGDGNGLNAANLLPKPADFKLKQPNTTYLLEVLREGIPGTAMPSWKDQIPDPDRRALAAFVRSLFEP